MCAPAFSSCGILGWCRRAEIWRIQIIFPRNADQCEKGIAASVGEGSAHPMRASRYRRDRANRPLRADPFARGVGKHRRQIKDARRRIEGGSLDHRQSHVRSGSCGRFPIRSTGGRSGRCVRSLPMRPVLMLAVSDFSGLTSRACALARAAAKAATDLLDCCTGGLGYPERRN